jgi:hypothetical protein
VFDLVKSDFDSCSSGSQGVRPCKGAIEWRLLWWFARVFGLAKERLNGGCSGGLRGYSALQRSD